MHMARGGDAQGGEGGCTCILCIPPGYATASPPTTLLRMRGGDIYAHMCASLCSSNGQPAIQAKYTYSTLLPAFLLGCVVYASATLVTDFTRSLSKHCTTKTPPAAHRATTGRCRCRRRRTPAGFSRQFPAVLVHKPRLPVRHGKHHPVAYKIPLGRG